MGKNSSTGLPPAAGQNPSLPTLTLGQAERMAIRNNPRVTVGKLLAMAQRERVGVTRSAELPLLNADVTGVDAANGTRLSAGALTASRMITHAGAGAQLTQLIYDFGHTRNLVLSQKLHAQASNASALATTEEIVLATDQAFYNALTAQALLEVAKQTVKTRQTTDNQVRQMTQNKLKSTLDLTFADVDLSQAQLLRLNAQDNADASMAVLDDVLGLDTNAEFRLEDKHGAAPPPPPSVQPLIREALAQRPDLQALNYDTQSAMKYAHAERDQMLPSISAAGTLGTVPVRTDAYYTANWWGAVGGNVRIPLFNGLLYWSQAKEARYREQAAAQNSRDLRDRIVRDVQTSWLETHTAWQRLAVTAQLANEANLALRLATTRYRLGLSSIVELSQAQLQQTSAAIQATSAMYEYRLSLATLRYEEGIAP